jgi:uncharacterized membrane protein
MIEFLQTPEARLVLWMAGFAALLAVGFYIIAHARRSLRQDTTVPTTGEMMSNFRELYSRGALSDEEYRTIKGMLSQKFQKEIDSPKDPPAA